MNPVCSRTWGQPVAPPVLFAIHSHMPSQRIPETGQCCLTKVKFHRSHCLPNGWSHCCCSPNHGAHGLTPWLLYLVREFSSFRPCGELECPCIRRDQFGQIPPPRIAR